ncbi:hypothetical protein BDB01DRAFT_851380 [Pilobolus umbonatus]|nr:hypothetical protein BDB01DRAFT_851380 [Pilobolus umbonatus]
MCTVPRSAHPFSITPNYSLYLRHAPNNQQTLSNLPRGLSYYLKNETMVNMCWDAFDMTKTSLSSFTSMKDEERNKNQPLAKSLSTVEVAAQVDLDSAVVWGLDPGLIYIYIYVATDNDTNTRHRIRKTSTSEYYHLAGYHAANLSRAKISRARRTYRNIIAATPSFRTRSTAQFLNASTYVFNHFNLITRFL